MKVLIVDDHPIFCRFLAGALEAEDIQADWTPDGLRGYEMSLAGHYDLYIVEEHMPLVLGTELAEVIQADKPDAKIILISALPEDKLANSSGIFRVSKLSKPFSPNRLLEEVRRQLSATGNPRKNRNLIRWLRHTGIPQT